MAKGKGNRGDAKLRVIPGGAGPKVVLAKSGPARSGPPSSGLTAGTQLRQGPPNTRRGQEPPAEEPARAEPEERASAIAEKQPAVVPRVAIFAGLVLAVGALLWVLTRNMGKQPTAPTVQAPLTVSTPAEWAVASAVKLIPAPSAPGSASGTTSAAPAPSASP